MRSILTVDTAATSTDLTSLATVKAELNITSKADDATLARYIDVASSRVVAWCHRPFARETVTETFRPTAHDRDVWCRAAEPMPLKLRRFPVSAVASVTVDGEDLEEGVDFEVETGDVIGWLWRLDAGGRRVRWSGAVIVVTYTGGYALLAGLPAPVQDACIALVTQRWRARGRDPLVKRVDVADVESTEYWVGDTGEETDDGLPLSIAGPLKAYRVETV